MPESSSITSKFSPPIKMRSWAVYVESVFLSITRE
jgi:hypothetical protein